MQEKWSHKTKIILTGVALLLAIVGTTYAWWTASYKTEQTINMGNLKISGNFPELTEIENYEPGTNIEIEGKIRNTGTIPAIIKIENGSKVRFVYKDDEFTSIPQDEQKFVDDNENAVLLNFKPTSGQYDDPQNDLAFWFKDQNQNIYLLLDPTGEVDITNIADFNGEVMGNKYQQSSVKIGAVLKATQVIDGAMKKEFGITSSDLDGLEDQHTSRLAGTKNRADQRLAELVNR